MLKTFLLYSQRITAFFNVKNKWKAVQQADERAGFARLSWRVSGRWAGRCRGAQLASIRQMSGQVSRGSAGKYQADERAGVEGLSWRVSVWCAGRSRASYRSYVFQFLKSLLSIFILSRIQRTAQHLYNLYIVTYVKLLSQNDNILNKIYINYDAIKVYYF